MVVFPSLKFTTVFRSRMPLGAGGFFFLFPVDEAQAVAYGLPKMKTKLDKVTVEIVKIDRTLSRFEAAQIAEYLLDRANGNLEDARNKARAPYRVAGKAVW